MLNIKKEKDLIYLKENNNQIVLTNDEIKKIIMLYYSNGINEEILKRIYKKDGFVSAIKYVKNNSNRGLRESFYYVKKYFNIY